MLDPIEKSIFDLIREGLVKQAEELIESKANDLKIELWDAASKEIDNIMSSIYISSFDNTATLTKEVHISLKGVLKK